MTIARPQDAAERRQVTVMFSDLVGSTALSARMDPEDLREVVSAYQKCVAETVQRFGGFVAKYMGDGVLIYFGYPQAHEDDAERAVRAGLELVAAVGQLKTHAPGRRASAIATGLVVVSDPTIGPERFSAAAQVRKSFAVISLPVISLRYSFTSVDVHPGNFKPQQLQRHGRLKSTFKGARGRINVAGRPYCNADAPFDGPSSKPATMAGKNFAVIVHFPFDASDPTERCRPPFPAKCAKHP